MSEKTPPGAHVTPEGVAYAVWAPAMERVQSVMHDGQGETRTVELHKDADGFHRGVDLRGKAGDAYGYRLNGSEKIFPDPASRAQQDGVHGLSLVVDARLYSWQDAGWKRPAWRDLVIYELHLGAFTPEGTFRAAIERLAYLKDLGVSAIEIMPIGDFPGSRNWGYDGVLIYAPAHCYGSPDDLRALIDAAHGHGIAVLLDLVFNHFGPDGNYCSALSPYYFNQRHHTPWGDGFNFDSENNQAVRHFFLENPIYWMEEFHIDGFRFDATHEIKDDSTPHVLAEITTAIHRRGGYAIAEDERNSAAVITSTDEGGLGFDGVWADDFHHAARVSVIPERSSYFQDFAGTLDQLVETLRDGWLFQGQVSKNKNGPRGTPCAHLPPERFVHCISNHDQVGNRALGERLNQLVRPEVYRALSALLCLTPHTPMLFMGQEWAASTPFLFFTDHNVELGRKITEGRRREFASLGEFANPAIRRQIPDPQAAATFANSKLRWEETPEPEHAGILNLYRECLRLRREHGAFRAADRHSWQVFTTNWGAGALSFSSGGEEYLLVFDLQGGHAGPLPGPGDWKPILSTEDSKFGGTGSGWTGPEINFKRAEAILFGRRKA